MLPDYIRIEEYCAIENISAPTAYRRYRLNLIPGAKKCRGMILVPKNYKSIETTTTSIDKLSKFIVRLKDEKDALEADLLALNSKRKAIHDNNAKYEANSADIKAKIEEAKQVLHETEKTLGRLKEDKQIKTMEVTELKKTLQAMSEDISSMSIKELLGRLHEQDLNELIKRLPLASLMSRIRPDYYDPVNSIQRCLDQEEASLFGNMYSSLKEFRSYYKSFLVDEERNLVDLKSELLKKFNEKQLNIALKVFTQWKADGVPAFIVDERSYEI